MPKRQASSTRWFAPQYVGDQARPVKTDVDTPPLHRGEAAVGTRNARERPLRSCVSTLVALTQKFSPPTVTFALRTGRRSRTLAYAMLHRGRQS